MRLRELLEQAAEDGELGREGAGVRGAQVGAVAGELGGGEARAVECREAYRFT